MAIWRAINAALCKAAIEPRSSGSLASEISRVFICLPPIHVEM